MAKSDRLYFIVRTDICEGRRAAQLIHAQDVWSNDHGFHGGTVIVYEVPDERALLSHLPEGGRTAMFREPDFDDAATAFATDQGPYKLPLLGSTSKKKPVSDRVRRRLSLVV